MWSFTRHLFPTSERLIKTIFCIHFMLFCICCTKQQYRGGIDTETPYFLTNCLFLVSFAVLLLTTRNRHHIAHIAGLINLSCIVLEVIYFLHKYTDDEGWSPKLRHGNYTPPEYTLWKASPFLLNLLLRFPSTILLLQIRSTDSEVVQQQNVELDKLMIVKSQSKNNQNTNNNNSTKVVIKETKLTNEKVVNQIKNVIVTEKENNHNNKQNKLLPYEV